MQQQERTPREGQRLDNDRRKLIKTSAPGMERNDPLMRQSSPRDEKESADM